MDTFTQIYDESSSKLQNKRWNDEMEFVDAIVKIVDEFSMTEDFITYETIDLLIAGLKIQREEMLVADMKIAEENNEKWDNVYPNNQ